MCLQRVLLLELVFCPSVSARHLKFGVQGLFTCIRFSVEHVVVLAEGLSNLVELLQWVSRFV